MLKFSPIDFPLSLSEIHIWQISQDQPARCLDKFLPWLDAVELQKASTFRSDLDRQRFVARHGLLRLILSRYLDAHPAELIFSSSLHGKPHLASKQPLKFNLSHSGNIALLAVAMGRQVGIDVELIRADLPFDELAAKFFSEREKAAWRNIGSSDKQTAFYYAWTRKEAFLKALGVGLSLSPENVDFTLAEDEPACLLAVRGDANEAELWTMQPLKPSLDSIATLVVEGKGVRFTHFKAHALPEDLNIPVLYASSLPVSEPKDRYFAPQ